MIIAVASGKGGTGKTMVATSLALGMAPCAYFDLDVEEPNGSIFLKPAIDREQRFTIPVPQVDESKCTFCGICAKACAFNAIAVVPSLKSTAFFPDLCHSCGACTYVCPVEGALKEVDKEVGVVRSGTAGNGNIRFVEGRMNVGLPSGVPLIGGIVNEYISSTDELIILDASPGTSCPVVETLGKCDFVLLVTEPTPFGLSDLKLTVELVREMGKEAAVVINKDNGKENLIDAYAAEVDLPVFLRIPYSVELQAAYSRGIPFTEIMASMTGMTEKFRKMIDRIREYGPK